MISYQSARKGCVKNMPEGFIPYEHHTIGDLCKVILNYTWSPIIFNHQKRLAANFLYADLCVLDIDNDKPDLPICTIEDAKQELIDCKLIIGTSKSHQISKNGKDPQDRFRVIIPFDRRIDRRGEYEATMKNLMNTFDFLDKTCVDAARQFFPCTQIVYVQGEGEGIGITTHNIELENPEQKTYLRKISSNRPLSKNVQAFLDHGVVFAGGRNNSIYHTANSLVQKGINLTDAIALISEAPFDRSGFNDKEIYNTCTGVYKRLGIV